MKDRRNIKFLILGIVVMLISILGFTFAFFGASKTISNTLPVNITIANGLDANLTVTGGGNINLTVNGESMLNDLAGNAAAINNVNLNVTLQSSSNVTCTYDIVWQWNTNTPHQYTKTTGASKEFVISGSNGSQKLEAQVPNYNTSVTTLGTFLIDTQSSTTTKNWVMSAKFYNLNMNQDAHAGKTYSGKVAIANANCGPYVEAIAASTKITSLAGTSGAGAADGHSGAMVNDTSDHGTRYVGENPSNFVWFNCSDLTNQNAETCERWRIIGVFNEKYDTNNDGVPDTEGQLVRIIRNDSLGGLMWDYKQNGVGSSTNYSGSNDWSDSQLMMMLNPTTFVNSGYVNESDTTAVHSNTINNGYVVSGGINIYQNMGSYFDSSLTAYSPASTTTSGFTSTTEPGATFTRMSPLSQSMIATVKWYLTGTGSYTSNTNGLASNFYNYERNIDNAGYVYTGAGTRPKIWYGKIGLMYPSDYGYATSGNSSVSGYDRASCLNKELVSWDSGSYQTYCVYNDWLLYVGATGNTSATKGTATTQWTITPHSSSAYGVFLVNGSGYVVSSLARLAYGVRPVLSLEASVSISGGEGTYDSPYILAQ